ncbi:YcxB family protein [Alisedimentitalea sp. MJ-SS2]|uniref:YcxB family protein n=1 Tax=Aliisedimentitalea sp. MJ-SS2 TaxID=3049795 RepID=UPI00291369CC|nr:YcxB family protein [Alisedimentitalea sp. MJ-SS2]MDU8928438.1 YcxB family protein [Alisedimentitalea sp. MJ-SS2]
MSEAAFEAVYKPTRTEIRRGLQSAHRAIFNGWWRVAYLASSFWRGATYAIAGFVLSFMVMGWFGVTLNGATGLYYGVAIFIAVLPLVLQRVLAARHVDAYCTARIVQGQRLRLDAGGIHLANGRSHSHFDWRDISQVIVGRKMLVAVYGNQGLVVPDRLFAAQGGDVAEFKTAILGWYKEARAGL